MKKYVLAVILLVLCFAVICYLLVPGSQDNLAGVQKEYQQVQVFKRYLKAAILLDDAEAQYNLGVMFYKGEGVEKNYQRAFEWY